MAKTFAAMKRRLEQVIAEAHEVEAVLPLMQKIVAKYDLKPADVFPNVPLPPPPRPSRRVLTVVRNETTAAATEQAPYRDSVGHTWSGNGRRPAWLIEALAQGASLDDFRRPEESS